MTDKQDLMLAVLAMDAYNCGAHQSIGIDKTTGVGDVAFFDVHENALFSYSATEYRYGTKKIIAYRGTDNPGWRSGVTEALDHIAPR
ncbi:hypothetical protein [Caulobacter segnis]